MSQLWLWQRLRSTNGFLFRCFFLPVHIFIFLLSLFSFLPISSRFPRKSFQILKHYQCRSCQIWWESRQNTLQVVCVWHVASVWSIGEATAKQNNKWNVIFFVMFVMHFPAIIFEKHFSSRRVRKKGRDNRLWTVSRFFCRKMSICIKFKLKID